MKTKNFIITGILVTAISLFILLKLTGIKNKQEVPQHIILNPGLIVKNQGQLDKKITYYAMLHGLGIFIDKKGAITYRLPGNAKDMFREWISDCNSAPVGVKQSKARYNYFKGNDPDNWHSNITTYKNILLGKVGEQVEVYLTVANNSLEKVFMLKPGFEMDKLAMCIEHADSLSINKLYSTL